MQNETIRSMIRKCLQLSEHLRTGDITWKAFHNPSTSLPIIGTFNTGRQLKILHIIKPASLSVSAVLTFV